MKHNSREFVLGKHLVLIYLLLIGFCGYSQQQFPVCGAFSSFYSKKSIDITTFGASTVQGIPAPLNFQTPLKSFLNNCFKDIPVNIDNYGIAGETTAQGLIRFDAAIANKTGFLLILMGANDVIQLANGNGRVSTTVDNMRIMIQRAKASNLDVILGTLQYFVEIPGRTPEALLSQRRNRFITLVNNAYKTLAKEENVRVADINAVIGKNKQLYADGIHPNARGYNILGLVWFDAINQEIALYFQVSTVLQNAPNPANDSTKLRFNLSGASRIKVTMYNMAGQKVAIVFDDYRNAGYHEEDISTTQYAAGIYLLYYEGTDIKMSKKLVIYH
ncbi:GDSL-type esterase/lipase family protein [Pedobacter sp. PWIIR3]